MSIPTILTRGFGNGTFNTTIQEVVTVGYTIGEFILWTKQDPVVTSWAEQDDTVTNWTEQPDTTTTWTIKPPSN